jgi:hypothetical protein
MLVALAPPREHHAARPGVHAVVRFARNKPVEALERFYAQLSADHLANVPPLSSVHLVFFVPWSLTQTRALGALAYVYRQSLLRSLLLVPCDQGMSERMCKLAQLAHRQLGLHVDACLEPGFGHGRVVRCSSFVAGAVPIVAPTSEHFAKFRRVHARIPFTAQHELSTLLAHTCGNSSVRPLRAEAVQVELGIAHAELAAESVAEE